MTTNDNSTTPPPPDPSDAPDVTPAPAAPPPSKSGFAARLRSYFFAGLLITAPVAITLYLTWIIIKFVDRQVTPLIPSHYNPGTYLPFDVPGLGLLIVVIGLMFVGAITASFIGRYIHRMGERILARLPVVRSVYGATKQIFETILSHQSDAFREAVLIEYPRRGIWAIGFITGKTEGEIQNLTEESVINIFLPTTPNPTSGFLLFVPKKDVVRLSMSVEEAIKMVISGGIVTPPDHRPESEQRVPKVSAATYEDLDIAREKDRATVLVSRQKSD